MALDSEYIKRCIVEKINMADGSIRVVLDVDDKYYYEMLSELIGENVASEYQLISVLKEMSRMRREYTKVLHAMESVRLKGYGVVTLSLIHICGLQPFLSFFFCCIFSTIRI